LAQNYDFLKNQKWLQQQFNTLAKGKDEDARFTFDQCEATLQLRLKNGQGGITNFDLGTSLSGIQSVSYKKEGQGFMLQILPENLSKTTTRTNLCSKPKARN
jgi:hypothetical protein